MKTPRIRRFILQREYDESGVSGTGVVAEGVQFSSGKCVMHWLSDWTSIAMYENIEELVHIHGHGGNTKIIWVDV